MPARCHKDSCSIKWDEVTVLGGSAYEAKVVLDGNRSLKCGPNGIAVELYNDNPLSSAPCYNRIRRLADGRLVTREYEARTRTGSASQAVQYSFAGAWRGVPNAAIGGTGPDKDHGQKSSSSIASLGVITNPYGCEALLLIRGQFNYNYEIARNPLFLGATDSGPPDDRVGSPNTPAVSSPNPQLQLTAFNANVKYAFAVDNVERVVNFASIGGVIHITASEGVQYKKDWRDWSYRHFLNGNQTVTIEDYAQYVGVNQNLNVQAAGDPGLERGFRTVLQITILPFVQGD